MLDPNNLDAGSAVRSVAEADSPWPTTDWWKAYLDPQLDLLVKQATIGNPSLRLAETRISRARSLAGGAKSALWPSINSSVVLSREKYLGQTYWDNDAILDFVYNLDLWGKNRNALEAALGKVKVAEAEARLVKLNLETAVVRAYIALSLQYTAQDIARTTLQQRQDILDITQKRKAAGLATEFELSQAEAPVPAARAELESITETIALLRNQLGTLTGRGPGYGEEILRPTLSLDVPIQLPSLLPADLLGRRPDVAAQRWRVESAGKSIKVAKAAFYPNINLTAYIGWSALEFAQFMSAGTLAHGFGPAITLPIFEGGRLRSDLGIATADYDAAVESYNMTLIEALQSVSDALVTLRSLDKQRAEADKANALAERAYGIAMRGYRAGLTNYLEVLNAQNQTLVESLRRAKIEARKLDAHALLMQALGGGSDSDTFSDSFAVGSRDMVTQVSVKTPRADRP
jgi:NodT family efflux transporter outer membrane factor (OMF) lipoprotein